MNQPLWSKLKKDLLIIGVQQQYPIISQVKLIGCNVLMCASSTRRLFVGSSFLSLGYHIITYHEYQLCAVLQMKLTNSTSCVYIHPWICKAYVTIMKCYSILSLFLLPQGWVDNFNGATGVMAAVGSGIMRTVYGRQNLIADLVPVDMCANAIITLGWTTAMEKYEISKFNVNVSKWN